MNRIKLNHLLVVAVVPLALSGAGCSEQARLQNLTQDLSPCDDGSEMPSKYFCDKIADCRDGSDEAYCYDFECGGGDSTGYASRCDGYEDCSNGRDEEDCYRAPYFEAGDANNGNTNNGSGPSNNTFEDPGNNDFEPRPGEIGSACEYSGDCPGVCLTSQDRGIQDRFANGYCSASCGGDYDCPSGAHCSSEGMCVDSCDSDDACRDVGYICRDHDRDGRYECYGSATGSTPLGGPCSSYAECDGDADGTCLSGDVGSGYCTLLCGDNGTSCPFGFVCQPGASGQQYCLQECPNERCEVGTCQEREGYLVCLP